LQTLLRLSPESGRFWLRYGDVLHKLGRTDEAVDAWDRVLDVRDAVKVDRTKARERLNYFKPPSKARSP
jgi:predicted TPR repeat methyltransferase